MSLHTFSKSSEKANESQLRKVHSMVWEQPGRMQSSVCFLSRRIPKAAGILKWAFSEDLNIHPDMFIVR